MKQSSLLKKYVLHYMICALIPVFVLAVIYYGNAQNMVIREFERSHAYTLRQNADSVDRRLGEFRTIALQLANDQDLTPYTVRESEFNRMRAVQKLSTYYVRTDFLSDLLLYYYGDDILYSGGGVYTFRTMTDKRYSFAGPWGEEDLRALLASGKPLDISPYGCSLAAKNGSGELLVLTYPCPPTYPQKYGTIVGLVNKSFFTDVISSSESEIASLTIILDEQQRLLFYSEHNGMSVRDQDTEALIAMAAPGGTAVVRQGGKKYTLIRTQSGINGWHYLSLLPHSQFGSNFITAQAPLILALAVLCLTGVLLSIYLGYRNYKPIRELWGIFGSDSRESPTKNELLRISQAARRIVDSNQDMRLQLDENKAILAQQELMGLLNGVSSGAALHPETQSLLTGPCFYVMVLGFGMAMAPETRETLLLALEQVMEGEGSVLELSHRNHMALVRNVPEGYAGRKAYGVKLLRLTESLCGGKPRAGVGGLCRQPGSLHTSYTEAMTALETPSPPAGEDVILFEALRGDRHDYFALSQSQPQMRLLQAVRQANRASAEECVREIAEDLESARKRCDTVQLRFLTTGVAASLIPLAEEVGLEDWGKAVDGILHYRNLPEFLAGLTEFCGRLISGFAKSKDDERASLLEQTMAYLDANCFRQDFSLNLLAGHVQVTAPYMSRFIRDNLDMNFMEYLTEKRMGEACRLLRETDLKIRQIVEAVGYVDAASFTRKFAQRMGMSPSRYRDAGGTG